jgi:hypothetical protein
MSELPSPAFPSGGQSNDCVTTSPKVRNESPGPSRMPASEPEIREVLHKIYDEARGDPPNVNNAWDLVTQRLPNARRQRVREVLRENEFSRQRREPGKRRSSSEIATSRPATLS